MKILGYIAAMNDGDIIDDCIKGLVSQTYPVSEILIVDNGSNDGTCERKFPKGVTLIRFPENRGTSGAAIAGFEYGISKGFDWIWVFDADSVPRDDALAKLMELYMSLSPELQDQTFLLASLPVEARAHEPYHGVIFTSKGLSLAEPNPKQPFSFYECHATMWTGSLYNLKAVQKVGLPEADYFLDWGDIAYGYQGKRAGYKAFMSLSSITDHNLHAIPTLRSYRLGPVTVRIFDSPPTRRYYFFRNSTYFLLYAYREGHRLTVVLPHFWHLTKMIVKICVLTEHPLIGLKACVGGIWDGLWGNLHRRY
jgi:rhamnosyltransferase